MMACTSALQSKLFSYWIDTCMVFQVNVSSREWTCGSVEGFVGNGSVLRLSRSSSGVSHVIRRYAAKEGTIFIGFCHLIYEIAVLRDAFTTDRCWLVNTKTFLFQGFGKLLRS